MGQCTGSLLTYQEHPLGRVVPHLGNSVLPLLLLHFAIQPSVSQLLVAQHVLQQVQHVCPLGEHYELVVCTCSYMLTVNAMFLAICV